MKNAWSKKCISGGRALGTPLYSGVPNGSSSEKQIFVISRHVTVLQHVICMASSRSLFQNTGALLIILFQIGLAWGHPALLNIIIIRRPGGPEILNIAQGFSLGCLDPSLVPLGSGIGHVNGRATIPLVCSIEHLVPDLVPSLVPELAMSTVVPRSP